MCVCRSRGANAPWVKVYLDTRQPYVRDCDQCESGPNPKGDIIECVIGFQGELERKQVRRLTEISGSARPWFRQGQSDRYRFDENEAGLSLFAPRTHPVGS